MNTPSGPIILRRREGGFYQGFAVASGRLVIGIAVLLFLLWQLLVADYPYTWFLLLVALFFVASSALYWWRQGRRIQQLELRPGGLLRIGYPMGQREFRHDALGWVKVYADRVSFMHAEVEHELRGLDTKLNTRLDQLVSRLEGLGVAVSDRRD